MFITDPGSEFFHLGSLIQSLKDPGSRIRIRIKEFKYFQPKNCFQALGNMIQDIHTGSWIRIFSRPRCRIWIQGSKKYRIPDQQH
jgi:hypothetical protein